MKPFNIFFLAFIAVLAGCRTDPAPSRTEHHSLPFETPEIKIEVASENLPDAYLGDIYFLNETTGFAFSRDGRIFKTNDKGKSWELKYTNTIKDQPMYQMVFTDANTGYVVAGASWCNGGGCSPPGGIVIKTTDGGETWNHQFRIGGGVEFVSIAKSKNGSIYLLENSFAGPGRPVARILRSSNGGDTFVTVHQANYHLQKIAFGGDHGFGAGGPFSAVLILRSDAQGNNWTHTRGVEGHYPTELEFFGNTGLCITDYGMYMHMTNNLGESWFPPLYNTQHYGTTVNLLSEKSCLIWGNGDEYDRVYGGFSAVHLSSNSGNSWTSIQFGPIGPIRHTSFYNAKEGYALGTKLLRVTVK